MIYDLRLQFDFGLTVIILGYHFKSFRVEINL